jgi:hypothetical protein
MSFTNRLLASIVFATCCAGCSEAPTRPSASTPLTTTFAAGMHATATYNVTVTASPTCADSLPADVRSRTYRAVLYDAGTIVWSSPTVQPPLGQGVVSAGQLNGDTFSLTIGRQEDPQSDDFHGISDVVSPVRLVNISGTGSGRVDGNRIDGTLAGDFTYYDLAWADGPITASIYCTAADHRFTFVEVIDH